MWLYHVGRRWTKRLMLTGDTVTGADAADIGLALKAVPADLLEAEVEQLARRMALVDRELLAANKRIVTLGLELTGPARCSVWPARPTPGATRPPRRGSSGAQPPSTACGTPCAGATRRR